MKRHSALQAAWRAAPQPKDFALIGLGALALRFGIALWAAPHFPPADDGKFYAIVAQRIAQGLGYTWLWPDGAVTYAAHYPVGYPALLAAFYAVFGPSLLVATLVNALLGAAGAAAVQRLVAASGVRGPALLAGGIAAAHPGLLFYTPALMTEGAAAALLALLGALAVTARRRPHPIAWWVAIGLCGGLLVLIRPQALVLLPLFGYFAAAAGFRERAKAALWVTSIALCCCLPWTLRNCARLDRCVLVSANGGWNLFIGSAPRATGAWVSVDELGVPPECREVFGEAEKDQCFGRAGVRQVLNAPRRFVELVPKKLAATFDWSGAAGHYLNASNAKRCDERCKLWLGVVEAAVGRLVLLGAFVAFALSSGPRGALRRLVSLAALPFLFLQHAWIAHVLFVLAAALLGRDLWLRPATALAAGTVAATALTHAVFFGAGRYGLVCALLLVAFLGESLAACALPAKPAAF